jgi:hypothetical protein
MHTAYAESLQQNSRTQVMSTISVYGTRIGNQRYYKHVNSKNLPAGCFASAEPNFSPQKNYLEPKWQRTIADVSPPDNSKRARDYA